MGALGQGALGGHISPLGAVAGGQGGRGLVLDVWPQTREPWAPLAKVSPPTFLLLLILLLLLLRLLWGRTSTR